MKKLLKSRQGFTLTEIMVVVIIIGLLVAIAVPVYNNISGNAAENACLANQRTIASAILQWQVDSKTADFPADAAAFADAIYPKYIVSAPKCGGAEYTYTYVLEDGGTPATYTIVCGSSPTEHVLYE